MAEEDKRKKEQEKMRTAYSILHHTLWQEAREQRNAERQRNAEENEPSPAMIAEKKVATNQSFERLQKEVMQYDDGLVKGWKEDIDTLLVFAGLFSAVVTAFLVESYQWLSEDPKDTAVILLTQISHQLNGTHFASDRTPFSPEASSIRINCFWFLSLIFSLTSALFGLLCKQWLREYQRDVPTRTAAESLALKQLRRDSFEKWGVASFLSALPILLELALLCFFVGVLDLLWTLHSVPFGISFTAIVVSVGLYFVTTFLPMITIPCDQSSFLEHHQFAKLAYQFVCPYKSPQAWAVYKLFTKITKPLLRFPSINGFIRAHFCAFWDHIQSQASSWSTLDLQVVRQFDQEVNTVSLFGTSSAFTLPIYELQALQWAVTMFRDSPSMIPHLENVLESVPPSVAMSVALNRWDVIMGIEASKSDVGYCLRGQDWRWEPRPKPVIHDQPLHYREGIELLFWQQHWSCLVNESQNSPLPDSVLKSIFGRLEESIAQSKLKESKHFRFYIPFPTVAALWSHQNPWIRVQSLRFLQYFEVSWQPRPGYDKKRHDEERIAFTSSLAWYILRTDRSSELLTSKRGLTFIEFIHQDIIKRRLYSKLRAQQKVWADAVKRVRDIGNLPSNHFAPLSKDGEDSPDLAQSLQIERIRYSVDTERDTKGHISIPFGDNTDEDVPPATSSWRSPLRSSIANAGESIPLVDLGPRDNANTTVGGGSAQCPLLVPKGQPVVAIMKAAKREKQESHEMLGLKDKLDEEPSPSESPETEHIAHSGSPDVVVYNIGDTEVLDPVGGCWGKSNTWPKHPVCTR
ncbi:hypothetical protein VNI00_004907 [Paramarasmius palmivorus]|uniref:DUF6535 domain-containing protein n=1 Tax=Paramarasmius palmivorus TaxID=297713 RepID=A0AAW0DKC1_9AGAR